jgi:hypothetical protein
MQNGEKGSRFIGSPTLEVGSDMATVADRRYMERADIASCFAGLCGLGGPRSLGLKYLRVFNQI